MTTRRFASFLLVLLIAAACQLQSASLEPNEITLTPLGTPITETTAEATAEATEETSLEVADSDLGIIAAAPPTDIVPATPGQAAPTALAPTGRCTATPSGAYDVNIREYPGAQYLIVGVLRYGNYLDTFGRTHSGWYQVDIPGTGAGWVSSSVVTLRGPCNLQILSEPTVYATQNATPIAATPSAAFDPSWGFSFITTQQVDNIPANTIDRLSSMTYNGGEWRYQITTDNMNYAEARESQIAFAPNVNPVGATPTSPFLNTVGGYIFITTEQVDDIPANTRVAIGSAHYEGFERGWAYDISTEGNTLFAVAYGSQLTFAPDFTPDAPTPTIAFTGGWGFSYVTTEQVGNIPANARVAITSYTFDGYEWIYQIITEDNQTTADARQSQLAYAPGTNPVGPTPTSQFLNQWQDGYVYVTTTQVGSIPANTRINIGSAHFDGFGWVYDIITENGLTAQARDSQIAFAAVNSANATLTAMPANGECRAVANTALGVVNLRIGPSYYWDAVNAFGPNDAVTVLARTDNGWYKVKMTVFEGFVPADEINLGGDCANLPVIATNNYQVTPVVQGIPEGSSADDVVIPADMCTVIATTSNVNVYSSNSPDSTVVVVLAPGPWMTVNARDGKGWYRVTTLDGGLAWVDGSQVQANGPCGALPVIGSNTSLPTPTLTAASVAYNWTHVSTVIEHGCGPSGGSATIPLTIEQGGNGMPLTVTYANSGTSFTLVRSGGPQTYVGTYGSPATVTVSLTFTSATSYTATETIIHESGCVVRTQWVGSAS
jgi:uncharacterized protein YgiM (DUF1202 family)